MTEHLTFIFSYELDTVDKYYYESKIDFIVLLPHFISRKNNIYPKQKIRISID
jgi:hypothetical protein